MKDLVINAKGEIPHVSQNKNIAKFFLVFLEQAGTNIFASFSSQYLNRNSKSKHKKDFV